jgi:hypothetical protein
MARSRRTRGLSDIAAGVLKRVDKDGKRHGARAVTAWREVVGPDIAAHTQGFAFRGDRELVVFVDGAAWANQLTLMADDLLGRVNTHVGEKTVRSLRFTVSRKVKDEVVWRMGEGEVAAFYKPLEPTPTQLNEIELQQAAHVASPIKNPELRKAALRVMIKDLEQKKGSRKPTGPQGAQSVGRSHGHEG